MLSGWRAVTRRRRRDPRQGHSPSSKARRRVPDACWLGRSQGGDGSDPATMPRSRATRAPLLSRPLRANGDRPSGRVAVESSSRRAEGRPGRGRGRSAPAGSRSSPARRPARWRAIRRESAASTFPDTLVIVDWAPVAFAVEKAKRSSARAYPWSASRAVNAAETVGPLARIVPAFELIVSAAMVRCTCGL